MASWTSSPKDLGVSGNTASARGDARCLTRSCGRLASAANSCDHGSQNSASWKPAGDSKVSRFSFSTHDLGCPLLFPDELSSGGDGFEVVDAAGHDGAQVLGEVLGGPVPPGQGEKAGDVRPLTLITGGAEPPAGSGPDRPGLLAGGSSVSIGARYGCTGLAYLYASAVVMSGPPVAFRAAGASRRGLPAAVPSVMPVPVMKTSNSTPAGTARVARPCKSSR
jgi:hypothetical protein